ncbi:carbon monoxide dehydrogenase [Rhodococcus opacus]|nr:carbon monoxide dehydrogenase [Rhodococcus opacus]RZL78811.1 MAG: carbon monoxide dehydrogenase [Rhodococcus sp. (in: high G+C Gram-positive bacteria)]
MELTNTFSVDLPVAKTWDALLDLGRVIPCLPGAAVLSLDGDEFEGAVKIKVGPVSAQYKGAGRFVEKDPANYRAVIAAEGKDVGGQGGAKATITATLSEQGSGTTVHVLTDLALSGRAASFGRGVIADVSNKILGQFAKNLEAEIARGAANGSTGASQRPKTIDEVEPLDVMGSMSGTVMKYALPGAGALAAVIALIVLLTRKGRGPAPAAFSPAAFGSGYPPAGIGLPLAINLVFPTGARPERPLADADRVFAPYAATAEEIR